MIEANSTCPKCGAGIMKVLPTSDQLVPQLPKQAELTARCDKCGHRDQVKVVATDQ
jgi:C4-type Zn-finger protein